MGVRGLGLNGLGGLGGLNRPRPRPRPRPRKTTGTPNTCSTNRGGFLCIGRFPKLGEVCFYIISNSSLIPDNGPLFVTSRLRGISAGSVKNRDTKSGESNLIKVTFAG